MVKNEEAPAPLPFLAEVFTALRKRPPEIPDERLLKFLASYFWELGRINETMACLRLIERREEIRTPEIYMKGYWQLHLGDVEGASKTFSNALRQAGDDPGTLLGYGYVLFYQNDFRRAGDIFQRVVDAGVPSTTPAIMAAASRAMAAGERPEMIEMPPLPGLPKGLQEVLQIGILHGVGGAIEDARSRIAVVAPEARLPLRRLLAELYLESNQEQQAVEILDELSKYHADDGVVEYLRGIALRRAGQLEESRDAFLRALTLAPLEARAWGGFAASCMELNETERAVQAFHTALFLDDRNAHFWGDLGMAESKLGNFEQARSSFSTAIELGMRNFTNYFNRGVCSLNLNETESALDDWQTALAMEPNHPRAAEVASHMRNLDAGAIDDRFVFGEVILKLH